jgi:hypothetical protein
MKPLDNSGTRRETPSGDEDDSTMPLLVSRVSERFIMSEQTSKPYTRPYSYYEHRGGWGSPNSSYDPRGEPSLQHRPVSDSWHHPEVPHPAYELHHVPSDEPYRRGMRDETLGAVGQKFIRLKTPGILLRVENGPSATLHLPTPQLAPGPPMTKGPLSTYNVKVDRIGGRRGRAGIGTMGAATAGGRTTRGSRDMVVTLVANITTGSVGIFKTTALNETRKTERGSLLRRGNHRRGAVGVGKASAIRTTGVTRIGTGVVGEAKRVATITSKDGISDLTIVT